MIYSPSGYTLGRLPIYCKVTQHAHHINTDGQFRVAKPYLHIFRLWEETMPRDTIYFYLLNIYKNKKSNTVQSFRLMPCCLKCLISNIFSSEP